MYEPTELKALDSKRIKALAALAERFNAGESIGDILSESDAGLAGEMTDGLFGLFVECGQCAPDAHCGDNLLETIHRKFAGPIYAAIDLAGLSDGKVWAVVDPDCDGPTRCVVVDFDNERLDGVYYNDATKAWHYEFPTLAALADEVLRIQGVIETRYAECARRREIMERFARGHAKYVGVEGCYENELIEELFGFEELFGKGPTK